MASADKNIYSLMRSFSSLKIRNKRRRFVFIVPSYNNEDWVENNIKSILNQTYSNWHIIYVDDNSTDNTYPKLLSLISDVQSKVTIIRNEKNYGQAFNRYMCYNLCNDDDMCVLLDGDDWLADKDVLSYLNDFIEKHDVDLTYRNFNYFNGSKITGGYNLDDYSTSCIQKKAYRSDRWRAGHLRVILARYLKNIDFKDFMDQDYNFITCCTDRVESFAALEQSNGRHKMTVKPLMIYNKHNSEKYATSEYKKSKVTDKYRALIEQQTASLKSYHVRDISKGQKHAVVINIESNDYIKNINRYEHELRKTHDVYLWKFSDIDIFNRFIKPKYENVVYFDIFSPKLEIDVKCSKSNSVTKCDHIITYLIACHNCKCFIKETLDSLTKQTSQQFNVILVDDASTDNLSSYLDEIINQYTFSIKYFENTKNIGYAHTLANAIGFCDSSYFATLDSDDTIEPETTDTVLKHIKRFPDIGFFYTNFYYCDENLNIKCKGFCKEIPPGKTNLEVNGMSQLRIFRKSDYFSTQGYMETNLFRSGAEDKDIFYKMEEKCKVKFINRCLYRYRRNNESMTKKSGAAEKCKALAALAKRRAVERRKRHKIIVDFLEK